MFRLAVVALVAFAAACSTPANTTPPAEPPSTVTVVSTPPVSTAPPAAVAKTCTVPNVVGKIHQEAQDTMQAAGLYLLKEVDASGQGRLLINDRNWRTTAQSIAAGTKVECTAEITLTAEKIS